MRSTPDRDELRLEGFERLNHYALPFLLAFAGLIGPAASIGRGERTGLLLALLLPVAVGLASVQRRALRFERVRTPRRAPENYERVLAQTAGWRWNVERRRKDRSLQLSTPVGFGSWGERVTVLFRGSDVLVNSICDPAKRASVVSFGRNAENVRRVSAALALEESRLGVRVGETSEVRSATALED